MSNPPPPPNDPRSPFGSYPPAPPPFQPPPGYGPQYGQPPPGYMPFGTMGAAPRNSGMAIAGMVLSLVGLIPCFWLLQLPGVLGIIFGAVGMQQTKDGSRRGRGMAIAGVVIGIVLVALAVLLWIVFRNRFYFRNNTGV